MSQTTTPHLILTQLFVYPIKALKGIALQSATLNQRGIEYDRHWMLVDERGKMITQRDIPELTLFETALRKEALEVRYRGEQIQIPYAYQGGAVELTTTIWGTEVQGLREEERINGWFSQQLGRQVELMRVAEHRPRLVKRHREVQINFPDSNQYLIIGEATMDLLNSKLEEPLNVNRFRPNMVFRGGTPHMEDEWGALSIGEVDFMGTKSCGRCKVTTIDQETAVVGMEPLRTLAQYRFFDNKILFGRYLKMKSAGMQQITVGDTIAF
ncbi:MAG: MOSC N-terminal beta barrel domain-containing protein [Bacteroidota bacterium]